jgi:hypothetical protein
MSYYCSSHYHFCGYSSSTEHSEVSCWNALSDKHTDISPAALALIFSIGLIPVIASTMRLCEIIMSESPMSKNMTWQQADFSWGWAWVPVWSQIEVNVGIVAASLPSLSPLFKQIFGGCHTQTRASTPSQIPTIMGYRESWGVEQKMGGFEEDDEVVWDADIGGKLGGWDVERRLTVREKEMGKGMDMEMRMSYYDGSLSDVEEEDEGKGRRSIGTPRMADIHIIMKTGQPRVVEYVKL